MENITRRRFVQLGLLTAGLAAWPAAPALAAGAIESIYQVAGPHAVATGTSGGHRLYCPAVMTNGHPIITWGNGTNATPDNYPGVLHHFASWGFAVVASTDTTTGTGSEMIAAAEHLRALNADSGSVFYGKLDIDKVAAVGHSQGAGGAVNTATGSGFVAACVPIALPAQIWVSPGDAFNVAALTCPVFFMSGANDWLISSAGTLQGYYDQVPGAAARALLEGAGHNDIQNSGGGFLGYSTAWLRCQLMGDTHARAAFAGDPGELLTNTAWQNQAVKNLV